MFFLWTSCRACLCQLLSWAFSFLGDLKTQSLRIACAFSFSRLDSTIRKKENPKKQIRFHNRKDQRIYFPFCSVNSLDLGYLTVLSKLNFPFLFRAPFSCWAWVECVGGFFLDISENRGNASVRFKEYLPQSQPYSWAWILTIPRIHLFSCFINRWWRWQKHFISFNIYKWQHILMPPFCSISFSICVTVIVLNIHFRSPQTHTMAPWVRTIFINHLPKLLVMKRPMYGGLDQYRWDFNERELRVLLEFYPDRDCSQERRLILTNMKEFINFLSALLAHQVLNDIKQSFINPLIS